MITFAGRSAGDETSCARIAEGPRQKIEALIGVILLPGAIFMSVGISTM